MTDEQQAAREAMSWVLEWLDLPSLGVSEATQIQEADRLRRRIIEGAPLAGSIAAIGAACTAAELLQLLTERDPQAAKAYVADLRLRNEPAPGE